MVGHVKYKNVFKNLLTETGVASINWTQFKQGRTTRWGLAWTFDKNIDLLDVFDHLKLKRMRSKTHTGQVVYGGTTEEADDMFRNIFKELEVKNQYLKVSLRCVSFWCNILAALGITLYYLVTKQFIKKIWCILTTCSVAINRSSQLQPRASRDYNILY